MMLFSTIIASAHDFEVDGIFYNITSSTDKTVAVTYCGSSATEYPGEYSGNVTIPETVTYNGATYSVTSIGSSAFYHCGGLTSVTIPNSVTSIGSSAFYCCRGLTSVTIPNSVTTIGPSAFYYCTGLTSVTIPNSVTEIGSDAFDGTEWYNNQSNGVIYINNVLYEYKGTMPTGTSITIKDGTVSISISAFRGCTGLTEVTIPNSVTTIGSSTFLGCTGLTSVTIPNSVTTIGDYAFLCGYLTEVNITDISSWCKIDFGNVSANPLWCAKKLNLNGSEVKDLVIPNDITEIKNYAFSGCHGLTSVTIPNSVTTIGSSAFSGCRGLRSVTIGNSVASIGVYAFYDCGIRLIMCHCATPPVCAKDAFADSYTALLMIPEGSLIDYALADEWYKFTQVHEVSEANVSTQKRSATFEIPTIEGADEYVASVYSDATMSQLVATTNYDAYGKITPMSTILELSIDGFDEGVYYYKVYVKSKKEGVLKVYLGTFEIELSGIEDIMVNESGVVEVERYDVHGRRLEQPTRGINIIKMSDGSTRKEWVK